MIDWSSFLVVALASITGAGVIVTLYALGIRLLSLSEGSSVEGAAPGGRSVLARAGAIACFCSGAAAAILGLYLIIPAFH